MPGRRGRQEVGRSTRPRGAWRPGRVGAARGQLNRGVLPMSRSDTTTGDWAPSLEELAAKYFGPAAPPVRVDLGALSHPGRVRRNNEDHYAVVRRRRSRDVLLTNLPEGFLPPMQDDAYALSVADGMGGHAFGEVASMMALRVAWELTGSAFKWHFKLTAEEAAEITEQLPIYF